MKARAYTHILLFPQAVLLVAVLFIAPVYAQPVTQTQAQTDTRNRVSSPNGFQEAEWGSTPAQVQQAVQQSAGVTGWQPAPIAGEFPPELGITAFRANTTIAGYPAEVVYYFWQNQFFQATVRFPFNDLVNFDFNFNVYRSVNEYYEAIRARTINFVQDIYTLLGQKYGRRQPVFRGLDPRQAFTRLDAYLRRERWNLRYHPYEFYRRIVTAAYARWDFPKTRIIFSINISAPEKRFDYMLSAVSLDLEREISSELSRLRMRGL
ncbi:MAG: hypothetical protein LBU70_04725 [Chitinispirillales bacterium]|jgi:hypothetical protein|nr:hypothetical protein [Chitinispirillales bacterium]